MRRLLFAQLTYDDFVGLVKLYDHGIRSQPWDELIQGHLTEKEERIIDFVVEGLRRFTPSLVNEATVWGRAIFPLLCLAETEELVVHADVPLLAHIGEVELAGSADGAFGRPIAGELRAPFLIVVEAKRGVEAYNPVMQLYGELLAAACLNAKESGQTKQLLYGCYTVADDWTFVRADIDGLDTERPSFSAVSSEEINGKAQAAIIVKILKSIVRQHVLPLKCANGRPRYERG